MDISDSDSDGFFSDIRTLRRKLGLSTKAAPTTSKAPAAPANADTVSAPPPRPSVLRVPQASAQRTSDQVHRATAAETAGSAMDVSGRVTPQEIAALLSPRKQRSKKTRRLSDEQNTQSPRPKHTIPVRTPESRIASPRTPTHSGSGVRRADVDSGSRTGSSPGTPAGFSMRSLWDSADLSPLRTPARRPLGRSPLQASLAGHTAGTDTLGIGRNYAEVVEETGMLGSVEDALITEKDLDHAQRKLGEAEAATQQQILRELRERTRAFSDSGTLRCTDNADWWPSVTLLCQFHTLGHGKLGYGDAGVLWKGSFVGAIASAVQSQAGGGMPEQQRWIEENLLLVFPWHRVSCVRRKTFDDSEHIMMTVDEDLGVAFHIGGGCSTEDIQRRVASMNACLSDAMARRRQQQTLLGESSDSDVGSDGIDIGPGVSEQQTRLVESLLRHAVSSHSEPAHGLDISRCLRSSSFMNPALELVSQCSRQLAAMAAENINNKKRKRAGVRGDGAAADASAASDDPGTETIPGTCTLCYAAEEAVILHPCEHRVCDSCFAHLKSTPPTSSQTKGCGKQIVCVCPWDRSLISRHVAIK
ncbi:hypothetical protein LPJ75_001893 [Coemansia sp. RSA 2598]|nr:hypothetical protein LPJ75_001893 [Coemansia sp. RSA 2598]